MKKVNIIIICTLIILLSNNLKAQKQNYNWFFGYNAGLTWKTPVIKQLEGLFGTPNGILTDLPANVAGSPMRTYEGCFSISDANGNLLFFSDGTNVYDKNMSRLSSTLLGNPSSTQSGTIVLYPNEANKYVVISVGQWDADNLSYSIINVDPATRLVSFQSAATTNVRFQGREGKLGESVTVGRHTNRKDLWVLAPGRSVIGGSGPFFLNVWKIDENGPQVNVHSSYEINDTRFKTYASNPGGYIRFSNDSQSFAWMNFGKGGSTPTSFLCYGKFNNLTGQITEVKIKEIIVPSSFGYGVEFTNDGKYLYLTFAPDNINGNLASALFVYDFQQLLAASDPATVNPIKQIVTPVSAVQNAGNNHFGSIQSGPDGRMYVSKLQGTVSNSIYVIDNPKDPENLRIYKLPFTMTGQVAYWGLPNFAVPWYTTNIELPTPPNGICAGSEVPIDIYIVDGEGFDKISKISIDFGDGTDPIFYSPVIAGIHRENHTYKEPGIYSVTITSYAEGIDENNNTVDIETTSVSKTLILNTCGIKVNPFIRGDLSTN